MALDPLNEFGVGLFVPALFGPIDRPPPDRSAVRAAHEAVFAEGVAGERAGFEGLFVGEQHMRHDAFFPDPFLLLATLATRTERVRLGTCANVLTLWDPMHVAETAALIDHLSQGRFTLVSGMGYHDMYWRMFGIDGSERVKRFRESMDVLLRAWLSAEPFSYHGEVFQYENIFLAPRPYQDPHPPVWGAAQLDQAIQRIAEYSTGWVVAPFPLDPELFRRQRNTFRAEAARNNVDNPKIILMRNGFCASTRQEAERIFGEFYAEEMRYYFDYGIFAHDPRIQTRDDVNVNNLRDSLVIGSPDDCIESIERCREEYEADYVIMRFRMNDGPTSEETLRCIELFGEAVLPRVQRLEQAQR